MILRQTHLVLWGLLLLSSLVSVVDAAQPRRGTVSADTPVPVTDGAVTKAIAKGKEWLVSQVGPDAVWPEKQYWHSEIPAGHTEVCAYALLATGDKKDREAALKALEMVVTRKTTFTYTLAYRTMALAQALRQMPANGPKTDMLHTAIVASAQALVTAQRPEGNWGYSATKPRPDLCNTHAAIAALNEAAEVGIEIPSTVWQRTFNLLLKEQAASGGWGYGNGTEFGDDIYGSMTAAGLTSLLTCADRLNYGNGCPCTGTTSSLTGRADLDRRIDLALKWLGDNFATGVNPPAGCHEQAYVTYWHYTLLRASRALGFKDLGTHDWYKEVAAELLATQEADGSWPMNNVAQPVVTTSFALLVLSKGGEPLLASKLQPASGTPGWKGNAHPRDAAGLVDCVGAAEKLSFRWQLARLGDPLKDLAEAPILYLSLDNVVLFSAEDKKQLRSYTDAGGTILAEAVCGSPTVKKWFPDLAKEVWPEGELKILEADHPIFARPSVIRQKVTVQGLTIGNRTIVYFFPDDLSCAWLAKGSTTRDYLIKCSANLAALAQANQLKVRLKDNPNDKAAAARLVRLLVVELDDPAGAASYAKLLDDETSKQCLAMVDMAVDKLPEAVCMALAQWYADLADTTSGDARLAMFKRSKGYATQFLKLHQATDADRTKATKLLGKATVAGVK
jgi:hypothetical protein